MKLPNLKTKFLGKVAIHYKEIDSTQLEMWRRIENNAIENGTIITADLQTNGIGTHGRTWYTDKKGNIAFSLFLKTECNIEKLEGITIEIATMIIEVFRQLYNIDLKIKYPNDIVYENKKIGGILTQTKIEGESVKYLVIGIGINTNNENLPKELTDIAFSIKKEFNITVDNEKVISNFLELFEKKIIEKEL